MLEARGEQIGVVTAIAAPHDLRLTLRGAATHAGATPMALRRDALAGAAEVSSRSSAWRVRPAARRRWGRWASFGWRRGRSTSCQVRCRSTSTSATATSRRASGSSTVLAEADAIAARRELELEVTPIVQDVPVACERARGGGGARRVPRLGLAHREMVSGAYHDAMILGRRVPVGMIFVPSAGGISHHPDEHTDAADIERGVQVLARTLVRLAE